MRSFRRVVFIPAILFCVGAVASAMPYQATVMSRGSFGQVAFAWDGVGTGNIGGNASNPAAPSRRLATFWSSPTDEPVSLHPGSTYLSSTVYATWGKRQVGVAEYSSGFHPFVWSGSASSARRIGDSPYAFVYDIFDNEVVGYRSDAATDYWARAAMWREVGTNWVYTAMHPQGPNIVKSLIYATDGKTQVGWQESQPSFDRQATRWKGTAASAVNIHPPGYRSSEARGVYGNVIGGYASYDNVIPRAMVWFEDGTWAEVHPDGATRSYIYAVGDGIQVGTVSGMFGTSGTRAALWRGSKESYMDLHALLPPGPFGPFISSGALGVDPLTNTIYGWADASSSQALPVVWQLVPEPGAVVALAMGSMLLLRRRG